jgi:TolA-binding protein
MPGNNIVDFKAALRDAQADPRPRLERGGGDGQPPGMETEIALLKLRVDQTDQRLERMEGKIDRLTDAVQSIGIQLSGAATKTTVWAALGTGAAIAFAVIAIFVAVLAYLQDQRVAARPEPAVAPASPTQVILQLPPWPTVPPPASPPTAN